MIPFDISILGVVFALILFIIFFSAIVLYLAFRIKETFRKETKRGVLAVKIAFLIGILFLAGGSFYFFAKNLSPLVTPPSNENGPSNETGKPQLNLSISYPSTVTRNTKITISFTITNPTKYTAHGVVIQTNVLFEYFSIVSSTHEVLGNVIKIGDVPPGTTVSSLELTSPERPGTVRDTITLTFQEMTQQISQEISISVTGGP